MKDTVHTKKAPKKAKRISSLTDVIEEGYLALFGDDIVLKEQNVFPLFALKSDPATSVCIDLHTGTLYLHTGAQYVAAEYAEMPGFLKNGGKGAGKYKHLNEKNWQDLTDKKRAQEIFEYHYPTALERIYPTDVTVPDFEAYYISAISGGVEKSVYLRSVGQDCWRVFFAKAEPGAPEFNSYSCSEYVLKEILAGNDRRTKSGKIDCCDRRLGVDEVQYLSAFMPNVHATKRPKGKPQAQQGDISYVAYYWKGDKSIACADEAYIPGLLQALEEIARCSVILEFAEDSEEAKEPAQAEESREPVPPESAAEEVSLTEAVAPQAEQKAEEKAPRQSLETAEAAESTSEPELPESEPVVLQAEDAAQPEAAAAPEQAQEMPPQPEQEAAETAAAESPAQPEEKAEKGKQGFFARFKNKKHKPAPKQQAEPEPQPEPEPELQPEAQLEEQLEKQPEEQLEEQVVAEPEEQFEEQATEEPEEQLEEQAAEEPEEQLEEQAAEEPEEQLEEQAAEELEEQLEEQTVAEPEEQLEEQAVAEPEEQLEEQAVAEPEEQLEEQAAEEPEEQLEEQAAEEPEEQLEEQAAEEPEEQLEEQAVEEPEEQLEEQDAEEPEEQLEEQVTEQPEEKREEQTAEKPEEQLEKQATEEQPDEQPEPQPEKQPEPQPERQPKLRPLPKRVRKAGTKAAMASGANFELPQLVSAYSASSRKKAIKKELVSALPSCPLIVPISAVNMEDNRYVYVSKQAAALCGERIVAFVLLAEKFPLLPGEENSEQRKGVMVKTVMNQSKTYIPVFSDFKTAAQVFGTKEKFGIFTLKNILNHMERNPSVAGITINPGAVKLKLTKQELEASE